MHVLDSIFSVIFARYRRQNEALGLESAWRRASNKVTVYLAWPIAAVVLMVLVAVNSLTRAGSHIEHKRWGQIAAGIVGATIAYLLNRRFRKFLLTPPPISSQESISETQLVSRFRAIAFGIFVLVCSIGALLRKAGFLPEL
jgi:hypothetical protein